jgi:hypothetical protein
MTGAIERSLFHVETRIFVSQPQIPSSQQCVRRRLDIFFVVGPPTYWFNCRRLDISSLLESDILFNCRHVQILSNGRRVDIGRSNGGAAGQARLLPGFSG